MKKNNILVLIVVAAIVCSIINIIIENLVWIVPLSIVVVVIALVVGSRIKKKEEKEQLQKEEQLKTDTLKRNKELERLKKERIIRDAELERDAILSNKIKKDYSLAPKMLVSSNADFETKSIADSYNKYICTINKINETIQFNEYVDKQIERLVFLNRLLGFPENSDVEKLVKRNMIESDCSKIIFPNNFEKLYACFVNSNSWKTFVQKLSNISLDDGEKIISSIKNKHIADYFQSKDIYEINLKEDGVLLFAPCYGVHILPSNRIRVVPYNKIVVKSDKIERQNLYNNDSGSDNFYSSRKNYTYPQQIPVVYIGFNRIKVTLICYRAKEVEKICKEYFSFLSEPENSDLFDKIFAVTEEQQKQVLLDTRNKIFATKESCDYNGLIEIEFLDKYKTLEEQRLNDSFRKYINEKNKSIADEQFNNFVDSLRTQLIKVNEELGYDAEKDTNLLPAKKYSKTICDEWLNESFIQLYKWFNKRIEWKTFVLASKTLKCTTQYSLFGSEIDDIYKEFFKGISLKVIELRKEEYMLFLPCYVLYISKGKTIQVIPYNQLKVIIEYKDESGPSPSVPNAETISQRYTYQNKDGTPNARYKYNPIVYTVRFSYIRFSWGTRTKSILCKDAKVFAECIEQYKNNFYQGVFAYIYKNTLNNAEVKEIKSITKEYETKLEIEQQKKQKKVELSEKKRLKEIAEKEAAEKKKRLLIIEEQRRKNEENLKRKELQKKANEIFADESNVISNPTKTTNKPVVLEMSGAPFSITNKKVITNNVFKIELKQEQNIEHEEYTVVFVDLDRKPICNERKIKKGSKDAQIFVGITLLSNIDFTIMKKCFLQILCNGKIVKEIPYEMNISFYSDF